jgi:iron complex outermembrane recepter protein
MSRLASRRRTSIFALMLLIGAWTNAGADDRSLADLSLEELLETEIYSVARADQGLMRSAAAVTVITREDIRRSGARTVAEALRLVPGMHVHRINSTAWAISARGFAGRLANKMLVMVDGRSVYSPTFSGVHWETLDLVLEDIERIEVMRGPGGTMWGANAVNGVVNILTREAKDTAGTYVASGGGTQMRSAAVVRLGGGNERRAWRVHAKGGRQTGFDLTGAENDDGDLDLGQAGFRLDRRLGTSTSWSLSGGSYRARTEEWIGEAVLEAPYVRPRFFDTELHGHHLVSEFRVERRGSWTLRAYADDTGRDSGFFSEHRQSFDLDLQHAVEKKGHAMMWGAAWRHLHTDVHDTDFFRHVGERYRNQWTLFAQDRVGLLDDRLHVTAGVKVEDYEYDRLQWQPSARAAWSPSASHTSWVALSRAVRAPSAADRDLEGMVVVLEPSDQSMGLPVLLELVPAGAYFTSESVVATEFGHRRQLGSDWQIDAALYHHDYDDLAAWALLAPRPEFDAEIPHLAQPMASTNALRGQVSGAEIGLAWQVMPPWRLRMNYTLASMQIWPSDRDRTLLDSEWKREEQSTPLHQVQFVSWWQPSRRLELDSVVTAYSRNRGHDLAPWVRWDLRAGVHLSPELDLMLLGQNLLRSGGLEWRGNLQEIESRPGRTFFVGLSWRND